MNKKVLTLCASFLLAGGLTSSVFAENIKDAAKNPDQYYYVFNVPDIDGILDTDNSGDGPDKNKTNGVLDVNGDEGNSFYSYDSNRETWWRVEEVKAGANGKDEVIGYKLINALTNKPFTVADAEGKTYDTFIYSDANVLQPYAGGEDASEGC